MDSETDIDSIARRCLTCGYDLRAAMRPGAGSIRCPECGQQSDLVALHHQGISRANKVRMVVLILSPAIVLLGSAWLFWWWSGESLHALLCLMLAPVVVVSHVYGLYHFLQAVGKWHQTKRRLITWTVILATIGADIAACFAVAKWFI